MPKVIEQPRIANFPTIEPIATAKENTMTTAAKTAARKNATAKKETAVKKPAAPKNEPKTAPKNEPKKPMTKEEKKAAAIQARKDQLAELKAKHPKAKLPEVVNVYHVWNAELTGNPKDLKDIYVSDVDKAILAYECIENGWPTGEFATAKQFARWGGTVPEGTDGFRLYGKTGRFPATYYNIAQVTFPEGGPAYDEDEVARQENNIAQYKESHRKSAAPKPAEQPAAAAVTSADVAALNSTIAALLEQNAMLIAALTANK